MLPRSGDTSERPHGTAQDTARAAACCAMRALTILRTRAAGSVPPIGKRIVPFPTS